MNIVVLMGRLTKDPDVRYSAGENSTCIARYTLAVDRPVKQGQEKAADFISCVAFGKNGEFAEKYLKKGMKISLEGRIQTGSYENKDKQKIYTTDVIVSRQEFAESKGSGNTAARAAYDDQLAAGYSGDQTQPAAGGFNFDNLPIDDNIEEELPFH